MFSLLWSFEWENRIKLLFCAGSMLYFVPTSDFIFSLLRIWTARKLCRVMISLVQCSISLCSGEIVRRLVVIANARTNLRGSSSPTSGRSSRSMMFAWIENIASIKDSVSVILMHRKGASCFATNYDDTEHAVTYDR